MNDIKDKLETYTPEQIEDIERIIELYEQIPSDKKDVFMLMFRTYMAGVTMGSRITE